jgi:hypothetical protein
MAARLEEMERRWCDSDKRYVLSTRAGKAGVWGLESASNGLYTDSICKELLGYRNEEIQVLLDVWELLEDPEDSKQVRGRAKTHLERSILCLQVNDV